MRLTVIMNRVSVEVDLPGVSQAVYDSTRALLDSSLRDPATKNRDAIVDAFLFILQRSPGANASDLWHHVVYRLYSDVFARHRPQNPEQSWKRASGDALEVAIERWYTPVLSRHEILIQALNSQAAKKRALADMGLGGKVGDSKLDVVLLSKLPDGLFHIFGGVHVKASLAERVSDDVPASTAMMAAGYFSPLWTLDVKSFPPPQGQLVNRGELGSPDRPTAKRRVVEQEGSFDACYSANSRTIPTEGLPPSGKSIYTLDLLTQPDQFVRDVVARSAYWRAATSQQT